MMSKELSVLERTCLIFLSAFPMLDTLSGGVEVEYISKLALSIKTITMLLMLLSALTSRYLSLALLSIIPLLLLIFKLITDVDVEVWLEIKQLSKIYFFFISALFFLSIRSKRGGFAFIKLIVWTYYLVICFNVFAGLLGYGGYTYDTLEYGVKGFIYAGNELSVLLFVVTSFLIYIYRDRVFLCAWIFLLSIYMGVSIATKTALLANLILFFYYFSISSSVSPKIRSLSIFSLSFLSVFLFYWFSDSAFFLENAERFNEVKWYNYLLSGREEYVSHVFHDLKDTYDGFEFLFGVTRSYLLRNVGLNGVEMDFVDIFLWNGFILLSILVLYVAGGFYLLFKNYSKGVGILILSFLLVFMIAFIAGHVFTSGMLTPILGVYFALSNIDKVRYDFK